LRRNALWFGRALRWRARRDGLSALFSPVTLLGLSALFRWLCFTYPTLFRLAA
jgi:hypothetical protein